MNEAKIKLDPATGDSFVPNRPNQKYSTLKSKNAYHRMQDKIFLKKYGKYFKSIKNDLKFLDSLMFDKTELVLEKKFMLNAGFDFDCRTNFVVDENGIGCSTVGPFVYKQINETQVKILRFE